MPKKALLPIALALLLLSSVARANRLGETVRLIRDTQVQMAAQDVHVRVTWEQAHVEAVFTFHNPGPATTVRMGFPEHPAGDGFRSGADTFFRDLRTWVDGVEVPVRLEPGLVPEVTWPAGLSAWALAELVCPAWHTWEVDFASGQTREVRNTYWTRHTFHGHGEAQTGYILVTGAPWPGTIGRARVTFDLEAILPHQLAVVSPGGYRFEGSRVAWEWTSLEPGANIELVMDRRGRLAVAAWYLPLEAGTLEELGRNGEYGALLTRVESLRATATPEQEPTLLLYAARAYQGLGRIPEADAAWEELLELAPQAGEPGQEFVVAADAQAEAFYYLAGNAHAAGDRAGVVAIYHRLRETRASLIVQRWVETLLPPGSIPRNPPAVTAALGPDPADLQNPALWLWLVVEDPDGDLYELKAVAWVVTGDRQETVLDERVEFEQAGYQFDSRLFLGEIPPGARVEYRVVVTDAAGGRGVAATPGAPSEDEPPRPGYPWLWGGLGAAAVLLLAAGLWLAGRRRATTGRTRP